jgi:hypothetical protein
LTTEESAAIVADLRANAESIGTSGNRAALVKLAGEIMPNLSPTKARVAGVFERLATRTDSEFRSLMSVFYGRPMDIPQVAWRTRNLMELAIWCWWCALSEASALQFYDDAGRDKLDILLSIEEWGKRTGRSSDWLGRFTEEMEALHGQAADLVIQSFGRHFTKVGAAARALPGDMVAAYNHWNKDLSKFAHPTAMSVITPQSDEKRAEFNNYFYNEGCMHLLVAVHSLEVGLRHLSVPGAVVLTPEPKPSS